jgi:cell division protein FtsI (penicillin-binding protein 3)
VNIKNSIVLRVRIAFILVFLFAVGVVAKVFLIQTVEGEKWEQISEQISFQYKKIKATRGNIYSDNGSLLATSLPFYKVSFDATIASDKVFREGVDSLSGMLSRHFKDKSKLSYERMLWDARTSGKRYIVLNRQLINYQEKKAMSGWPIFREGRLKGGVIFDKVDKRFRPFSNLSLRTIGFINENNTGAGLEYSFNKQLGGRDGEALFQKYAGGSWKPVYDGTEVRAIQGLDIVTTIDVNLQDVTESALLNALEYHNADYGTAIVMEVATGQIKAISNLGRTPSGRYAEVYNYAIGSHGLEEPGSTFKLATMIALLEETKLSLHDSIDTGNGSYMFYKNTVRDHHEGGYGKITVKEAFEVSSNIAMAKLVDKHFGLHPERFMGYIDQLGLSQPLGFQIEGEGKPQIIRPNEKGWSGITLPWMAYGYGLELTPIQILTLYNAVANEGRMIKPILVKEVRQADKVMERFEAEVINKQICSPKTLDKLKLMLEGVVENGTANNIKGTHYKIAGKTGTAQILENKKYTKKYITSFVGYFPAHAPKYSAMVLIRNPKGWRQYGSNVAAPVFKEVADNIYARDLEMHKALSLDQPAPFGVFPVIQAGYYEELKMICNRIGISNHTEGEPGDWVRAARNGNAVKWTDNKVVEGTVPDVKGMTLRDALFVLESNGLRVYHKGKGRVSEQSLVPGTKINRGSAITLQLG